MAGLWERVRPDVEDRVAVHLIVAAYSGYFVNTVTSGAKGATKAQILAAINAELQTPLSGAEQTDLDAIADQIDAQSNNINKLIFIRGIEYAFIAAEMGAINEAKWRGDLGI